MKDAEINTSRLCSVCAQYTHSISNKPVLESGAKDRGRAHSQTCVMLQKDGGCQRS